MVTVFFCIFLLLKVTHQKQIRAWKALKILLTRRGNDDCELMLMQQMSAWRRCSVPLYLARGWVHLMYFQFIIVYFRKQTNKQKISNQPKKNKPVFQFIGKKKNQHKLFEYLSENNQYSFYINSTEIVWE